MEYRVVLFKTRNKDNKHINGFKENSKQFLVTDMENVSEKFEKFVSKQPEGVLCRCYVSVNKRNGDLIQKQLISYLALNDMDLTKIESNLYLSQCYLNVRHLKSGYSILTMRTKNRC